MTPEELDKIEARAAKATEGPWETDATENEGNYGSGDDSVSGYSSYEVTSPSGRICDTLNSDVAMVSEEYDEFGCTAFDEVGMVNMEFIAAARQDVPALVAEVRRLQREADNAWRERNEAVTRVQAWEDIVCMTVPTTAFLSRRVSEWGPNEGEQVAVRMPTTEKFTDVLKELHERRQAESQS